MRDVFPACFHTASSASGGRVFFRAFCLERRGGAPECGDAREATATPFDAQLTMLLPFASEPALADMYRLFDSETVRNGLLLEHLDALAGDVALRHAGGRGAVSERASIVTAVVERSEFEGQIRVDRDVVLSGAVSWVGSTSMEVRVRVRSVGGADPPELHCEAVFVMVSVPRPGCERVPVPRLLPRTDGQRRRLEASTESRARRRLADAASVWQVPPRASESLALHSLFLRSHVSGGGLPMPESRHAWMRSVVSHAVCHFQTRNTNGQIFGGTLMRSALELAHSAAFAFAGGEAPEFKALDNVHFISPVPVGSVVRYTSTVAYTHPDTQLVVVFVKCCVLDPETAEFRLPTTQFHFTFRCVTPLRLKRVMPSSYLDAMMYLDARRSLRGLPEQ